MGRDVDSRMKDMEFILRYFALNTERVKTAPKGNISLKKLLNEFMGDDKYNKDSEVAKLKEVFEDTISFIRTYIGDDAFHNIAAGDPNKIRKRFYPTIFDSIMVGTSIALARLGENIPKDNLEEKRLELLQNESYRKLISEGTMQTDSIHGRISHVLEVMYGIEYK